MSPGVALHRAAAALQQQHSSAVTRPTSAPPRLRTTFKLGPHSLYGALFIEEALLGEGRCAQSKTSLFHLFLISPIHATIVSDVCTGVVIAWTVRAMR